TSIWFWPSCLPDAAARTALRKKCVGRRAILVPMTRRGSDRVAQALAEARAAWPRVRFDEARFAARLAEQIATEGDLDHAADLLLATACAAGDPAAHAALEEHYLADVPAALGRFRPSRDFVREVLQALRTKLLVSTTGAPKIAEYSGRGPLAAWIR